MSMIYSFLYALWCSWQINSAEWAAHNQIRGHRNITGMTSEVTTARIAGYFVFDRNSVSDFWHLWVCPAFPGKTRSRHRKNRYSEFRLREEFVCSGVHYDRVFRQSLNVDVISWTYSRITLDSLIENTLHLSLKHMTMSGISTIDITFSERSVAGNMHMGLMRLHHANKGN